MNPAPQVLSPSEARAKTTSWAITFSDLVTLMLSFFILLLVITSDAEKHIDRVINLLLDDTYRQLQDLQSPYVEVERVTKGVKITLASGVLFNSLEAEVRPDVYPLLREIGDLIGVSAVINVFDDPRYKRFLQAIGRRRQVLNIEIRCEGHTDDLPLPEKAAYQSNWDLSTARALNVVKQLHKQSQIPENLFSAMGYGEFRPVLDATKMGQSALAKEFARNKNRRVEIYLDAFTKKRKSVYNW